MYSAIQVYSGPILVVDVINTSKTRKDIWHRMQCTVSLVIWQADVWLRAMEIEIQYNLWPKWPGRTSLTLVPVVRQLLVFMRICYGIHSLRHTHTHTQPFYGHYTGQHVLAVHYSWLRTGRCWSKGLLSTCPY